MLARDVNCQWCPQLVATRSQIVESVRHGDPVKARRLFILLEAPGHDEDFLGEPIMGPAGRKLKGALVECGIHDYYVGNAIRCWPGAGNRDPTKREVEECAYWLARDLRAVRPEVVLCLGGVARSALSVALKEDALDRTLDIAVFEGNHPAAVLRRPQLHERFMESIAAVALRLAGGWKAPAAPFVIGPVTPPYQSLAADIETTGTRDKALVAFTIADGQGGMLVHSANPTTPWGTWPVPHTIMHDAKFDGPVLAVDLWDTATWDDTMLLAYVERYPELSLKTLERKCLNMESTTYEDLCRAAAVEAKRVGHKVGGAEAKSFAFCLEWVPKLAERYAVADSVGTYRLWHHLMEHVDARALARYRDVEKPLVPILAQMEHDGVRVDEARLAAMGESLDHDIAAQRDWLERALPGFESSLSPKLAKLLQEHGVNLTERTEAGRLAISKLALLHAVGFESVVDLAASMHGGDNDGTTAAEVLVLGILELRELETLQTTFVKGLQRRLKGDRVHCLWNQMVTLTGRLSSSDPNLQNQPVRSALGKEIRKVFLPNEGEVWLRLDASQLELRIIADYTQDPTLLAAYPVGADSLDIHQMAADAMNIERPAAKNAMFEIAYGGGKERLAHTAGIPLTAATEFWEHVHQTMPGLVEWGHNTRRLLESQGYLETRGRHLMYFPTYWSPNDGESADAFRSAVDSRIQGTAADIFKLLMVRGYPWIEDHGGTLLVQVHDELGISVLLEHAAPLAKKLQEVISDIGRDLGIQVPLELTASCGPTWGEQEEIKRKGVRS